MKNLGLVLLFVGFMFMFKAYNMDTTVTTESRFLGSGTSSIYVPSMTVNNLGKMEDRRNNIIIASAILIASVILYAAGSLQDGHTTNAAVKISAVEPNSFEQRHKYKIIAAIVFFWGVIMWCGWYMLTAT
ncbi:MAG: hypothetical protein FPO08_03725 [Geobacter sp.]|nr:MAG: hypothetical protein FPO08_03725 [Geobacter sp.]